LAAYITLQRKTKLVPGRATIAGSFSGEGQPVQKRMGKGNGRDGRKACATEKKKTLGWIRNIIVKKSKGFFKQRTRGRKKLYRKSKGGLSCRRGITLRKMGGSEKDQGEGKKNYKVWGWHGSL